MIVRRVDAWDPSEGKECFSVFEGVFAGAGDTAKTELDALGEQVVIATE